MYYVGIDIGSTASKVVVRRRKRITFCFADRMEQQGDLSDH